MFFKGEGKNSRLYAIIALIVVIIIVFTFLFSNQLTKAYIPDKVLSFWTEDIEERSGSDTLFGLEKWASFTYRNNNETYPAYVTVTSIKALFMPSEADLLDKTIEALDKAKEDGIILDESSILRGKRKNNFNHESMFVIYTGNDTSKDPVEKIKIIGETWNCVVSGSSVICIGFAQITDNLHGNSEPNLIHWEKIVGSKTGFLGFISDNGLIYNVKCH
jgi:hypothetical protein